MKRLQRIKILALFIFSKPDSSLLKDWILERAVKNPSPKDSDLERDNPPIISLFEEIWPDEIFLRRRVSQWSKAIFQFIKDQKQK